MIKDKTLFVVPNSKRENLLKEINNSNELIQFKIMTLKEFLNHYYFSYDIKSIYALVNKYNLKIETAIEYLDNLIFLKEDNYQNTKLNKLLEMKTYLEDNNYLLYDKLFVDLIKTYNIEVMYDNLDKFYCDLFKEVNTITKVTFIEEALPNKKELIVHEFNNIDDEIAFVATNIIELINSGININNIKLTNVTDEYTITLKRIFDEFNIPLNLKKQTSLYETKIGLTFLEQIKLNKSFEETIYYLKEKYHSEIINNLIVISNKYNWYQKDNYQLLDFLTYDLKNTNISKIKLKNVVEEIDLVDSNELDYIFLMGFNNENIPKSFKDDSIFNDDIREILNIHNTNMLNKISHEQIVNNIYKINNLVISYKNKTPFNTYHASPLIEELNMKVIKETEINYKISYSKRFNQIKLMEKLDNYIKYGEETPSLKILYNNYYDKKMFLSYDHSFKGIDKEQLHKYLQNKLILSYTTMDNYFRCSFKYYLSHILKLDVFEKTFKTELGNIFHYLLSVKDKDDFDLNKEFQNEIDKREFTIQEKFYLSKLKEEIPYIINVINYQKKQSTLDLELHEEKFEIDVTNTTLETKFKGFVDKIMYKEEENTLISIIDYKTGTIHANIFNSIYGIGMQLPVYLYLIKRSSKFTNPKIVGFYLQKILHEEFKIESNKTYDDLRKEDLKLVGYSTDNELDLAKFDSTFENSEVIKSMKTTKTGSFTAYSKVIDFEEMNKLEDLVNKKIEEASTSIANADFKINPKKIGDKNEGCQFCKYKDICYMTSVDLINLKEYKTLEFLGGDDFA